MKTEFLLIFFLIFLFSFNISAFEEVSFLKYETTYQILYFSSNLDTSVIPRLIREAEESEEFIKSLYGWTADKKIVTVYDRETDTANGWSKSYLKRVIFLYIFPPERYSALSSFKNWELGLHVHEYTHSTQIGMTKALPSAINAIFGDLFFPGSLIPLWMIEGSAIYSESLIQGKGRINSPLYKAYFDSFFVDKNQFTLGALSGTTDHWLAGSIPYLYGGFFYDYLIKNLGPKNIGAMFEELSDDVFPFLLTRAGKMSFNQSIPKLYYDFLEENRKRVEKEGKIAAKESVKERFNTIFADITSAGYNFFGLNSSERALFSFDGKKVNKIAGLPSVGFIVSRGNLLLFSQEIGYMGKFRRRELFLSDLKSGKISKLTKNGSVVEAIFGKNGDIFYISFRDGINRISRISLEGTLLDEWTFRELNSIYSLSLSQNGQKIAFSGNRHDSEKNIFIFDTKRGELLEIDIPGDQYSLYFKDDRNIVFSSEKGRKIVPMLLDLEKKSVYRLADPQSVALFPKIVDEELFFISFDNRGYFPTSKKIEAVELFALDESAFTLVEKERAKAEDVNLEKARFYEGLAPAMWLPQISGSSSIFKLGFIIYGESNDQKRSYDAGYSRTFGGSERRRLLLNYYDSALLPRFKWFFSYINEEKEMGKYYPSKAVTNEFYSGISTAVAFNHPLFSTPSKISTLTHTIGASIGIGGVVIDVKEFSDPLRITPDPSDDVSLNVGIYYDFSLNFNPSSRYLTDETNNFRFSLPLTYSEMFLTETRDFVFSPTFKLSFLLSKGGKAGFVTKNSFYASLAAGSDLTIGGDEIDSAVLNRENFISKESAEISVRGYDSTTISDNRLFISNNELLFHLISIDKGFKTFPLMLRNIQSAVFLDVGRALSNNKTLIGTGFELKFLAYLGYRIPFVLTLGAAYGFNGEDPLSLYLIIGN